AAGMSWPETYEATKQHEPRWLIGRKARDGQPARYITVNSLRDSYKKEQERRAQPENSKHRVTNPKIQNIGTTCRTNCLPTDTTRLGFKCYRSQPNTWSRSCQQRKQSTHKATHYLTFPTSPLTSGPASAARSPRLPNSSHLVGGTGPSARAASFAGIGT